MGNLTLGDSEERDGDHFFHMLYHVMSKSSKGPHSGDNFRMPAILINWGSKYCLYLSSRVDIDLIAVTK